jgi:hypothetical protein
MDGPSSCLLETPTSVHVTENRGQIVKVKLEVYHIKYRNRLLVAMGCLPLTCAAISVLPAQSGSFFFSSLSSCLDGAVLLGLFSREESEPEESITVAVLGACTPKNNIHICVLVTSNRVAKQELSVIQNTGLRKNASQLRKAEVDRERREGSFAKAAHRHQNKE